MLLVTLIPVQRVEMYSRGNQDAKLFRNACSLKGESPPVTRTLMCLQYYLSVNKNI